MSDFGVIDLTKDSPLEEARADLIGGPGAVDLGRLSDQLKEIRDAFVGITQERSADGFGLSSLEVDLTIGAEGRVWFVAKGSVEASIKLTFAHAAA